MKTVAMDEFDRARFWDHVRKDCWIWAGADPSRYGTMMVGGRRGRRVRAHRVMWELTRGPIPNNLDVLHRCDVPACVNPDHLFLGTHADNMQDAQRKHRLTQPHLCGESHGTAKLKEGRVRAIRESKESCSKLALRYGVSRSLISQIRRRVIWRHL